MDFVVSFDPRVSVTQGWIAAAALGSAAVVFIAVALLAWLPTERWVSRRASNFFAAGLFMIAILGSGLFFTGLLLDTNTYRHRIEAAIGTEIDATYLAIPYRGKPVDNTFARQEDLLDCTATRLDRDGDAEVKVQFACTARARS